MATYTPLPFVATPLDQSAQNLRLVDLLYQAQLDRIQREQDARLQGAQMWTALGTQLPQILNTVEQNRIRQMQAEADITRANAYEQFMRDQAALQQRAATLKGQEAAFEAVPGGTDVPLEGLEDRFGPYAAGFMPRALEESIPIQQIGAADTITLGELAGAELPSRPLGTLPGRPMGLSVLPGAGMAEPTEFGGFATKPKTKEQLAAEEATAKADEAARKAAEAQARVDTLKARMTPEQVRQFEVAEATRGMNLPGDVMTSWMGVTPSAKPPTMGELEAEDYQAWKAQNPGKSLSDYRAMVAAKTRAPREERDTTASDLRLAESFRRGYEAESKEWRIIAPAYGRVVAAYDEAVKSAERGQPSAAADISMVFAFMKMLDPNSVVREKEYATAEMARGVPESVRAIYNKLLDGSFLTERQRADFVSQAYAQVQQAATAQRERRAAYEGRVRQVPGITPETFLAPEAYVTTPIPAPLGIGGARGYSWEKK